MHKSLVWSLTCIAVAATFTVKNAEKENLRVVPLDEDESPKSGLDITQTDEGDIKATLNHEATIFDNGIHRLEGRGYASKDLLPEKPIAVGGHLEYSHAPSGSTAQVEILHTTDQGTDLAVSAIANLWDKLNLGAFLREHIGINSKPKYSGQLHLHHKF